jgi:hypothetical protein
MAHVDDQEFLDAEEVIETGPIYECSMCAAPIRTIKLRDGVQKVMHGETVAVLSHPGELAANAPIQFYPRRNPYRVYDPNYVERWTKAYHVSARKHEPWGGECHCACTCHCHCPMYGRDVELPPHALHDFEPGAEQAPQRFDILKWLDAGRP